jgi:hypothetical protein
VYDCAHCVHCVCLCTLFHYIIQCMCFCIMRACLDNSSVMSCSCIEIYIIFISYETLRLWCLCLQKQNTKKKKLYANLYKVFDRVEQCMNVVLCLGFVFCRTIFNTPRHTFYNPHSSMSPNSQNYCTTNSHYLWLVHTHKHTHTHTH